MARDRKGGQAESEEAGTWKDYWRRGIFVSSGENIAGSRSAASCGRDGKQVQQGFATGWAEQNISCGQPYDPGNKPWLVEWALNGFIPAVPLAILSADYEAANMLCAAAELRKRLDN